MADATTLDDWRIDFFNFDLSWAQQHQQQQVLRESHLLPGAVSKQATKQDEQFPQVIPVPFAVRCAWIKIELTFQVSLRDNLQVVASLQRPQLLEQQQQLLASF